MPLLGELINQVAAWSWIALLVVTAIAYLVLLLLRSDYGVWESIIYTPVYLFGRLLWRVHFANDAPGILREGGAILVANHRSSVDPCFVQLAAGRRVHWMVAREYCENWTAGPILRLFQVIPTNRNGMDTASTKAAIRIAVEGKLVGMFPEGQLNHTRDPILPVRPGAALVAIRAGVPIVPLWIEGSPYRREVWSPLIMPAHVRITFGTPLPSINLAGKSDVGGLTNAAADVTTSAIEETAAAPGLAEASSATTDRKADLLRAEQLMLNCAKHVLALGGYPNSPIRIAGRSRLDAKP